MKKHYFNVIAALALVCGVFAFSGCADYETDINNLNDRLDQLEAGQIASLEDQIANLGTALEDANSLIEALQGNVGDLEAADETLGQQIDAINSDIETVKGDIEDLGSQITSLESELTDKINQAIADLEAADDVNAQKISNLADNLASAEEELKKLIADGDAATITELTTKIDSLREELVKLITDGDLANATEIGALSDKINTLREEFDAKVVELTNLLEEFGKLTADVENLKALTASLPALEQLVDSIKNNYLSIEDAQATYATIKMLQDSIGKVNGRLDIIEEQIPELRTAVETAQAAADKALTQLETVFGDIAALKEALGTYATSGELQSDMEYLLSQVEALNSKDSDLEELINNSYEKLDARITAEIFTINSNIEDINDEIKGINGEIAAIQENMATKDDLANAIETVMGQIQDTEGKITEEMTKMINEATKKLQDQIDAINTDIDDINTRLDNLLSDLGTIVDDIADNIQSLVFVPEYKDGMATSYLYTVGGEALSEYQRVQATFQVTPAALAASITNENAMLYVVPVAETRAAAATEIVTENLNITANGLTGRVDIDALVPTEIGEHIAIALYVTDENVVDEVLNNPGLQVDLGNYVSSEYVQVALNENASKLDNKYALYNFTEKKVFPDILNVEKDWTLAPATVTFYEDYELVLNMGTNQKPEYVTLSEAENELRLPEGALMPEYNPITTFDPEIGNGVTINLDEEKDYGMIASMPGTSNEAVDHVGDIAIVENIFNKNGVSVIENVTSYEIIPVTYELNLQLNPIDWPNERIDWTYKFAQEHKIIYNGTQDPIELDETAILNWDEYKDKDGAMDNISDILENGTPSFDTVRRTVQGGKPELLTDKFNPSDENGDVRIDAQAFKVAQVANVVIDSYQFEKDKTVTYDIRKVYDDSEGHTRVIFNLSYTLGAMPDNKIINLGNFDINFIGSSFDAQNLGDRPYTEAFSKDHFASLEEFKASLADDGTAYGAADYAYTVESWRVDGMLKEKLEGTDPLVDLWTYLGILDEGDDENEPEPAYLRTSSSDIKKFGDQFEFTTTVDTWYGVTYEFNATSKIIAPVYKLEYDEGFAPNGKALLDGLVYSDGRYDFESVELSNYVYIANADQLKDLAYVKFEITTKEDQLNGIINIPTLTKTEGTPGTSSSIYAAVYPSNEVNDMIENVFVHWNGFTAREMDVDAVLYIRSSTGVEIEVNRLPIHFTADDPITLFETEPITISDRVSGVEYKINVWESFVINGILEEDKNIALYYGDAEPREYQNMDNMINQPYSLLYKYQPEITFGTPECQIKDGGYLNADITFDPNTGVLIFGKDNGVLQNDIMISIPVTLGHKMDYNGVDAKTATISITIKKQIDEL